MKMFSSETRMPRLNPISSRQNPSSQGSALLLTLLVVSLLMVLVLGLTVLVRTRLRQVENRQQLFEAKANAKLGVHIALAEIQGAAGADQRSAARANLMYRHTGVLGPSGVFPATLEDPLDTRSFWVGISHSDGSSDIGSAEKPVVWLVSGLDTTQSPEQQLTSTFNDPVNMLTLRDRSAPGDPIRVRLNAGKIGIRRPDNTLLGKYAWVVDDETQKAKLAPSVDVNNQTPGEKLNAQRTVLPGFFNPGDTTELTAPADDFFRAIKLSDLVLGTTSDAEVINDRFFDYTLSGYGVLSDTRNGGLKRDLTAAYENPDVFDDLFPNQNQTPYITMDPVKFNSPAADDLRDNGYIHHGIFRDYYGLKDRLVDGSIRMTVFGNELINDRASDDTQLGNVGPHEFNHQGHPYGVFTSWDGQGNPTTAGSHNPITPVLAYLQQNSWIEAQTNYAGEVDPRYDSKTQVWTGVYNPFNAGIILSSRGTAGPMFRGYPQSRIFVFDGDTQSLVGWDSPTKSNFNGFMLRPIRWIYSKDSGILTLPSGRTQVFGFRQDTDVGQTQGNRNSNFSKNIKNAVQFASRRNGRIIKTIPDPGNPGQHKLPDELDVLMEFPLFDDRRYGGSWNGASMSWGLPYDQDSSNPVAEEGFEVAQAFYTPFYTDIITDDVDNIDGVTVDKTNRPPTSRLQVDTPGVQFYRENVPFQPNRMGPIDEAFYRFALRTTTDDNPSIRPLIDGNIRALWNNPKWDHSLSLNALATYTLLTNKSDVENPLMPGQPDGASNEAFLSYGNSILDPGSERVILFDIPREPLVSLGQLQHAAAGRFSYEPTYIAGNSYANIRIPLQSWVETEAEDTYSSSFSVSGRNLSISGDFKLYDASYLVNESLFNGYTFTTIPQDATPGELEEFSTQTQLLPNPRYLPYEPADFSFTAANLQAPGSGRTNAGQVLVDGAFNVNSTSVEAWEVFLSGTKGLPYTRMNNEGVVTGFEPVDGVRFPRVQTIMGEPWETAPDPDAWFGFRELTTAEVRLLAEAIVLLIQERGPFHNLSEFINRPLQNNESGTSGVLQAALDAVINSTIPSSFEDDATASLDQIAVNSTQGAGFPTQLLQGDLLQALAPYMQTRSDTFTIRSYGEHAETGTVVRAEAVVQRVSDPIPDSGAGTELDQLEEPTSPFGRRFEIVSFRWLEDDEI